MKNFDEKKMLMFLIGIALIFVEIEIQLLWYSTILRIFSISPQVYSAQVISIKKLSLNFCQCRLILNSGTKKWECLMNMKYEANS